MKTCNDQTDSRNITIEHGLGDEFCIYYSHDNMANIFSKLLKFNFILFDKYPMLLNKTNYSHN